MPNRDVVRITLVVAATVGGIWALYTVRSVVLLVGIAAFLAIALEPSVSFFQRLTKSRSIAVSIMVVLIVLFVALFAAAVVPPLVTQTRNLIENIPEFGRQLQDESTLLGRLEDRVHLSQRFGDLSSGLVNSVTDIPSIFGSVLGFIADFLVVLILSLYFLLHAPKIRAEGVKLLPKRHRAQTAHVSDIVFSKVGGWMEGNILVSVIAGVVSFAALALIGVPYPMALAMWVAIADLIPMVGAMIGAVVCIAVAFFGGVVPGVLTTIFFFIYQQVENYLIGPRIMKRTVDVSPVAVIVAALVGGTFLGAIGVLLAVPAAASLKVIAHELWLDELEAEPAPTPSAAS